MAENKIPAWLRKPKHKKEVVASEKGWIVKDTGELLVRVPGLSKKLAEYLGTEVVIDTSIEKASDATLSDLLANVTDDNKHEELVKDDAGNEAPTEVETTEVATEVATEVEKEAEASKTEEPAVKLNKDGTPRKKPGRKKS